MGRWGENSYEKHLAQNNRRTKPRQRSFGIGAFKRA